jgi:type I site-specific restriction-modification system R (restriction) subunit
MSFSPQNTASPTRVPAAPWFHCSEFAEPMVERVLTWFEVLGYTVLLQSDIVSGRHQAVLQGFCNGILSDRFRQAMQRINPTASPQQIESLLQQLITTQTMPILQQNRRLHLQLLEGINVEADASAVDLDRLATLKLVDCANLQNNDWLVIHSFPVIESDYQHCLDLVVFINGLPLVVFHSLHTGEETWSLRTAYLQLQEYKDHLPQFFSFNELLVLSNGVQSRIGTLTNHWKGFIPIRSVNGEDAPYRSELEVETLIQGVFDKRRFFEIIQHFIVFQQSRTKLAKKLRRHAFCTITIPKNLPKKRNNLYPGEVNGNGSQT